MCKNASATAASLMAAIEPTLTDLLNYTGIANTPDGEAAISAYNAALQAVQNWVPGSVGQNVIQLIDDFSTVFDVLPLPETVKTLENIIAAGIATVIGVITANSPAPATTSTSPTVATPEETTALHQVHVIEQTTSTVQTLVPGFKRSIFTSPVHQYRNTWNKAVENGKFPETLKVS